MVIIVSILRNVTEWQSDGSGDGDAASSLFGNRDVRGLARPDCIRHIASLTSGSLSWTQSMLAGDPTLLNHGVE